MLINQINNVNPTEYEYVMRSAFNLIKADVQEIIETAGTLDRIGRKDKSGKEFNKIAMYNYVLYYCILIRIHIQERINNGLDITWDNINEEFDIDCLRDNLGCYGIKIRKILDHFGYNENLDSTVAAGVGYDSISIGSQVFYIRKTNN